LPKTSKQPDTSSDKLEQILCKEADSAWQALNQIRSTWDDKERALLAQVNDSYSGNVVRARVTDAALSTLAWERQARVAAQLPTGRVYAASKKDEGKARLMNLVLNNYILPNAGRDVSMETLQRQAGVYASVYGSVPIFYDYCVDDDYIGPYAQIIDPRCFLPQPGFSSTKTADWVMVSTIESTKHLQSILKRKTTTYDKTAIKELLDKFNAKDATPSRDGDAAKDSVTSRDRYTKEQAKGRIELITKYERGEKGHWITFAPDYDGLIIRDIQNPHKSGRIPVVMRHCFPLMNSIYGLGDFERGIRLQKAKDSLLGLYLEGAKQRIFPAIKVNWSKVTPSTIKNQANAKWSMTSDDMNAAQFVQYGSDATSNFQSTWGSLQSMLMNQFGTTDTSLNQQNSGNPAFGKTPEAIKQLGQRENARDNWDRAMHEECWQEVYEGMINLISVKMEKPINFMLFEDEIRQLSAEHKDLADLFSDGKSGQITLAKKDLKSETGFRYLIDANSSMKQDDQEQFQALSNLLQLVMSTPGLLQTLQQSGFTYDLGEHIKLLFISSGIQDWERILQESTEATPGDEQAMGQQPQMPQLQPPDITHLAQDPNNQDLHQIAQQLLQGQQVNGGM
jgi:hypothetical protein